MNNNNNQSYQLYIEQFKFNPHLPQSIIRNTYTLAKQIKDTLDKDSYQYQLSVQLVHNLSWIYNNYNLINKDINKDDLFDQHVNEAIK